MLGSETCSLCSPGQRVPDLLSAPLGHWEDLRIGLSDVSPGRTVTESDVVLFAGLSGDYNPIHTDRVQAAELAPGGAVLAQGLLVQSIGSGLFTRGPLGLALAGQVIAMLEMRTAFRAPVRIGDTVHVESTVKDLRETSDPRRGIAVLERRLVNQAGEIAQETEATLLLRRR
jgi:3-hydroxybutyryl-CoA dehydratase